MASEYCPACLSYGEAHAPECERDALRSMTRELAKLRSQRDALQRGVSNLHACATCHDHEHEHTDALNEECCARDAINTAYAERAAYRHGLEQERRRHEHMRGLVRSYLAALDQRSVMQVNEAERLLRAAMEDDP